MISIIDTITSYMYVIHNRGQQIEGKLSILLYKVGELFCL